MLGVSEKYNSDFGMQYFYPFPPGVLPVGTAPAGGNNYLGIPGNPVQTQFTIVNNDFVGIDLTCPTAESNPFEVGIKIGYVDIIQPMQDGNGNTRLAHSATVFGLGAGQPQRLFIPIDMPLNFIITVTLQDISAVANNLVYITVNGVQKRQVG